MNLPAILFPSVKQVSIFYIVFSLVTSCNEGSKHHNTDIQQNLSKEFSILSPAMDEVLSMNDTVHFSLGKQHTTAPDSVKVFLEGDLISTEKETVTELSFSHPFSKVGRQNFRLIIYYSDSLHQTLTTRVTVLSDQEPVSLSYRLIRKIPHDTEDYTQGLIYYNNRIYQGTGRVGSSTLKKINPNDGSVELVRKMDEDIFGEGITILNHKIYQLTYLHKIGYVYDIASFEQLREFDLQTMQGWGLTTDGTNLIVSDGSSVLYFYDPEYFNQVKQLDVCHNRGLVTNLNELEYVGGAIWANVYGDSFIVKIDAETGKVLARLELEPLFPPGIPRDIDHVLNGIAYNSADRTFFVTGKYWPFIYEIDILE